MQRLLVVLAATAIAMLAGGGAGRGGVPCSSDSRYVQPSLSENGNVVAYVRDVTAGCTRGGALFLSATLGPSAAVRPFARELTAAGSSATDPVVAPNGSRVAFTRLDADPPRIETLDADGSNPRVIGPGTSPTFSHDGRRLAYAAPDGTIRMVEANGTERVWTHGTAVTWAIDWDELAIIDGDAIVLSSADEPEPRREVIGFFEPPLIWGSQPPARGRSVTAGSWRASGTGTRGSSTSTARSELLSE